MPGGLSLDYPAEVWTEKQSDAVHRHTPVSVAISIWFGTWSFPTHGEVKSDRRGGLDWNQVVDNLRTYLDEKKRRLEKQQRVESLRQQAVQVIEAYGVRMHVPRHCEVGRAFLEIDERDVLLRVRVPIRHRHKLRSLIEFFKSF